MEKQNTKLKAKNDIVQRRFWILLYFGETNEKPFKTNKQTKNPALKEKKRKKLKDSSPVQSMVP